jgi:hypothetical protein
MGRFTRIPTSPNAKKWRGLQEKGYKVDLLDSNNVGVLSVNYGGS